MTKHFNEISDLLNNLGRKYNLADVFNDFLTMTICSYHQTNIKSRLQVTDKENENLYLNTIKKYNQLEIEVFPKILGKLQMQVYDYPYSDILGEYFTLNITNGQNGQYFTPDHICTLMCKLHGETGNTQHKTVLDPACGSARMLLSFAKDNPNNHFFGADVSMTCAKMATINFFLNGLRGEVAWMNSLSMEWYGAWHINTNGLGIVPIDKEQSQIWSHSPIQREKEPNQGTQLILF